MFYVFFSSCCYSYTFLHGITIYSQTYKIFCLTLHAPECSLGWLQTLTKEHWCLFLLLLYQNLSTDKVILELKILLPVPHESWNIGVLPHSQAIVSPPLCWSFTLTVDYSFHTSVKIIHFLQIVVDHFLYLLPSIDSLQNRILSCKPFFFIFYFTLGAF